MITIAVPADWSPETAFRHLDLASMVVQVGAGLGLLGLVSWYEIGPESTGPDPRYNLSKSMGLKPCPTGPPSPIA
jgi:hypothetical protein